MPGAPTPLPAHAMEAATYLPPPPTEAPAWSAETAVRPSDPPIRPSARQPDAGIYAMYGIDVYMLYMYELVVAILVICRYIMTKNN